VKAIDENLNLPVLYVFAISHYCEKARWALDSTGFEYELRHLPPGIHIQVAQDLGAAGSSLPILVADTQVVHGSGAIIDWVEALAVDPSKRLSPDSNFEEERRVVEARLDEVSGIHVRRCYYSEAVVDHPDSVRPMFSRDLSTAERQSLDENWEFICQVMIRSMDLGPEQRIESRRIVEGELDWLDGLFSDGRQYLVGHRFSRADITAASLLAPLAQPKEHPTYGKLDLPPLAEADVALWSERPALQWVRKIYREHR
jgi:glutathione S-transferase